MGAIHIDNPEITGRITRLAQRLGMSVEEAIERGLREFEEGLDRTRRNPEAPQWLVDYWRNHPLPPPTGLLADKAFFDNLCGQGDA